MESARETGTGELDLEDPQLEEKLVNELKAQGIFDQFRQDCLSDVDTKPAYQNLRVRVDKSVSSYLSKTTWRPTLNKNQLRNQLRKYIQDMSGVEAGVDRIVDQIVNPKLNSTFMPEVENVIYKYFGTSKPEAGEDMVNGNNVDDSSLKNGDSSHEVAGKISTRNLSTISSDAEMMNSGSSSPGPGLAGNVSPLTPGGSPKVDQGNISPFTPSTTPPLPKNALESQSLNKTSAAVSGIPAPPPSEEVVSMEVDAEEVSRPPSAYTPPLPPPTNAHHSTPEKSYTPPLPSTMPPCPPGQGQYEASSPHTPPLPPLPRDIGEEDSGGEASMSSISDTDLGDVSPPVQRKESPKTRDSASDISDGDLQPSTEGQEGAEGVITSDKDPESDEELQHLEEMKAKLMAEIECDSEDSEIMAQIEGDFKLSPEESDSDGEADRTEGVKDSPTSPEHSSRSETPTASQISHSAEVEPERGPCSGSEEVKAISKPLGGDDDFSSLDAIIAGPRTPPMAMSRTPSQSPSPPPRKGPQTPPSPPSAFGSVPSDRATTPPQEGLSKLDISDTASGCKPFSLDGNRGSRPDDEDERGVGGPTSHGQLSSSSASVGTSHDDSHKTSTGEVTDSKQKAHSSSHTPSTKTSHSRHSSSKDKKAEKKMYKIKEQTNAKIEKYEKKIKSKDKLKSDKYQDLDIFSTTKKPATPYQPHRTPKPSSGSNTPVTNKPPRDFEIKLAESIKKEVQRREEEKERRRKEEEKNNSFKIPVKIEDRRRSSSDDKAKEKRGSKDEKEHTKHKEKERVERKSSIEKERRGSTDEKKEVRERDAKIKDSKYEKERELQALESKKRLQDAREKKEKEERDRKRQKDKERKDREKKSKDDDKSRSSSSTKSRKELSKIETKDILKDKIGTLGIDNIQKMLMETLAEKTGTKFSDNEKKEMIKQLEGLIKKKQDEKLSPSKDGVDVSEKLTTNGSEKPSIETRKKSPVINKYISSESSEEDSESEGEQRIRELKNRIQERRKSGESIKSGRSSPVRTRPVRNKSKATTVIKKSVDDVLVNEDMPVDTKVNDTLNEDNVQRTTEEERNDFYAFTQTDVDFMVSIKEKYDAILQDEDLLSVSSISSDDLNNAIPSSKLIEFEAGPNPEQTVNLLKQYGGNPKLFTPVPEWLHPYLVGAKVKVEDVGMPTKEEISEYLESKQTKSKKRGAGWDIVVEWVPTAPPPAKKSKLEKELGFDVDSSFGQTVALSGGKRTRRANTKYSEDDVDKGSEDKGDLLCDQIPSGTETQPSNVIRTHTGSSQTPKRNARNIKKVSMKKETTRKGSSEVVSEDMNVSHDDKFQRNVADNPQCETNSVRHVKTSPISVEDIVINEESPNKKRRSKDIIAAYLTSAGVERNEPNEKSKLDESKSVAINDIDLSSESIIGVADSKGDQKAVVALLDAEISAADEELEALLKCLKRKRSSSGDSKFHGWPVQKSAAPRTGFGILLETAGIDRAHLDTTGASFGMSDMDFLMSSEGSCKLLEVVMSQPILRDIKKAESLSLPAVDGIDSFTSVNKDSCDGKGKHSDSESEDRGSLSPSSFGSSKENDPEICNSAPSKFSQKRQSKLKKLINPVLKTSVEVS